MQDGDCFFGQKTTGKSFPCRFLSFLMGLETERYDFLKMGKKRKKISMVLRGELWYNMEKYTPK